LQISRENCRFEVCANLTPDGNIWRCNVIAYCPDARTSKEFACRKEPFNVAEGDGDKLAAWLARLPECCQYCSAETHQTPHLDGRFVADQENMKAGE
jgi:hypothetical protein